MTGAGLLATTLPTVIAMGVVSKTTTELFKKKEGAKHYHFRGNTNKVMSHSHGGGHISHYHRGSRGYGRTRKSLKR